MNKEAILDLANFLRTDPRVQGRFTMDSFFKRTPECGTVGCIAGWHLMRKFGEEIPVNHHNYPTTEWTDQHGRPGDILIVDLELDQYTVDNLVLPNTTHDWSDITPQVAARCLEILAETGSIRWDQAIAEEEVATS